MDQTDFVVEKVLEHNESGLGLRRQAILVRTAYWSDHLEVELTRRNIPYRKYGGLKFLEAAHIKDLMSFLSSSGFTRMRMLVSAIWSNSSKSPPRIAAGRPF